MIFVIVLIATLLSISGEGRPTVDFPGVKNQKLKENSIKYLSCRSVCLQGFQLPFCDCKSILDRNVSNGSEISVAEGILKISKIGNGSGNDGHISDTFHTKQEVNGEGVPAMKDWPNNKKIKAASISEDKNNKTESILSNLLKKLYFIIICMKNKGSLQYPYDECIEQNTTTYTTEETITYIDSTEYTMVDSTEFTMLDSTDVTTDVTTTAYDTTTTTTEDPFVSFCSEACLTGNGGSACECASHPIG